jgi:two-component system, NarL family, invasion response regulator UvrY
MFSSLHSSHPESGFSMTRILVADDHQIVRAGLKNLLADYKEFTVAGEAGSGTEALKMVREADWDVVLLDISMPDMNGIDTLKQIKRSKPDLPVLILTMHPEDHYAINLLRAGANGYVCKECAPEQLVGAIRTVASGRRYVSPALGDQLAGDLSGAGQNALHTELSEREFQVFCKLAAGQAVSEIADELFLSVKTVSTYRSRILEKMGMKTNANITYYAIKHGLIQ